MNKVVSKRNNHSSSSPKYLPHFTITYAFEMTMSITCVWWKYSIPVWYATGHSVPALY